MSKRDEIISEVRDKVEDYETSMSSFLSEYNEWADIFTIKRPRTSSSNGRNFSNPRLTEGFRAAKALSTTTHRMITAQEPYFDTVPMDLNLTDVGLDVVQTTIETQLKYSEHKRKMLRAITSQVIFGTVIVEEPFDVVGVNNLGRRMPLTGFEPRSLLQVAFDKGTYDIETADWITVADIVTKSKLRSMAALDFSGEVWHKGEVEASLKDDAKFEHANMYLESRLQNAGYSPYDDYQNNVRELIIYRGKLDTMNDNLEYVVGLVNRKFLVRFHPNQYQHGRRNLRVARWFEFELEPLSYGLGKLLSAHHKAMDSNRQKVQDSITFDTYSMWLLDRMANINASEFRIQPQKIIETDNINGMKRVDSNTAGASLGLKLEEIFKADFQNASGATPTLQAIITEATASEVSLTQNEALRDISIRAENTAEALVRQHVELSHANNMNMVDEPFNIYLNGKVKKVYPSDLWYDVDFKVKVVTDKDYKPQRLKSLVEMLQVLTSIRNEHPEKFEISIMPIVGEIARSLGMNAQSLIRQPAPQNITGLGGLAPGGPPLDAAAQSSSFPAGFGGTGLGGVGIVNTPVGPVLGSP